MNNINTTLQDRHYNENQEATDYLSNFRTSHTVNTIELIIIIIALLAEGAKMGSNINDGSINLDIISFLVLVIFYGIIGFFVGISIYNIYDILYGETYNDIKYNRSIIEHAIKSRTIGLDDYINSDQYYVEELSCINLFNYLRENQTRSIDNLKDIHTAMRKECDLSFAFVVIAFILYFVILAL